MNITINGKDRQLDAPATIEQLLESLELDLKRVAVELNKAILAKDRFAETSLQEGDALEIVQFVGGG